MLNKLTEYLIDKLYDGDVFAFKAEPIVCTTLSIFTVWGIDWHIALTKIVGAGFLACMSVFIGVVGPLVIRLWMHKLKVRYPVIAELLKHDRKNEN